MPLDPNTESSNENAQTGGVSPSLSATPPPVAGPPPPPPLPRYTSRRPSPLQQLLVILLNLCLGLYLADAAVSLDDDSLILFFGIHILAGIRGTIFLFAILIAALVFALLGAPPPFPQRFVFPLHP